MICIIYVQVDDVLTNQLPTLIYYTFNSQMSEIEQLIKLISDVLQPSDSVLRKNSENTLVTLRKQRPNELMSAYVAILHSEATIQYRNFSASQLRLCLSNFAPPTYENVWSKLTAEVQSLIKLKLFESIYKENDLSMKRHIADTLGEVAGSIISGNEAGWPDFKIHVWTLFQDPNVSSNLAAFYILESFFTFAPEYFKNDQNELYALFKNGLVHQNQKLRLSALKSFASYLEVLEIKKQPMFQQLVISIYEAVFSLLSAKIPNEEGLEVLSEMLDIEPKFFKKKFKELVELLKSIFHLKDIESGVKRMATEILVDYAEKSPTQFRKKKDILESVIEMVFFHMVDIEDNITEQWMRPPEGYNEDMEDDEDFETTRFGMGAIDRLIYSIGEEELLPILSHTIEKLLQHGDWRYKYTAVMALSQIGEYIEDPEKISSVLTLIVKFLRHQNPMIRYSSCHAIGQISDDMQPKFQQKYGNQILPELINLLSDSVPRVVSHAAASLTNFLEGMSFEQVLPHLDLLVKKLINLTMNGSSLVKESALSAISSTVEISKEHYQIYLDSTLEILFSYFGNQQYAAKQYKQLKGQSIETLTIIASSVGGEMFKHAAPKLIQLMINLQSSQFEQTDPQKSYILAGWQRLCLVYGRELASSLDQILPSLFNLVQNVIKTQLQMVNSEEKEVEDTLEEKKEEGQKNINTFETEEAEVAISMLNVFIEQLKELYSPYVERTVGLLLIIIKEHPNEDVKEQACRCLPNLINAVKGENQAVAVNMAKLFMQTLVETVEKQYDSDIIIVELDTLKCVIEELNLTFLTEAEVSSFSQKMLKILKSSDDKKQNTKDYMNEVEEDDEDEKELIGQEIRQEEEVQVAISELIGILFKTHKALTLNLANYLITNILPSVFIEGQTQVMLKFGIFLIDDMVQYLGYDLLQTQWFSFGNALLKFTSQKSCVLRQAACYGLGIFAKMTPNNALTSEMAQLWLQALIESIKIPKGTEKEKTYGHCRDNGVASIGKIIKYHSNLFDPAPYIKVWMNCLPLKNDKDEGIYQHELLVDIMLSKPEIILEEQKVANMTKVLMIYAEVVGNAKLYNKDVEAKIKTHVKSMQTDPFFNQKITEIWGGLGQKHRENLTIFMK